MGAVQTFAHEGHSYDLASESFIYTDRYSPVILEKPSEEESFTFGVFGDRTSGVRSGLRVLAQAVGEMNILGPDLVMTVGDLVQGYNERPKWLEEMSEYKAVMDELVVPWFPVAGNHDVYWRGENRPENEHEGDYEANFGPLWYAFEHKDCWFIVLFSDEGNFRTGEKNFKKPECQMMSPQQTEFLRNSLELAQDAKHVFVFLHHPRWTGGNYGNDWDRIHQILVDAGNVSACFAGHTHRMLYDGTKDNIEYYTLATTGGNVPGDNVNALTGTFHHYNLVTVRGDDFYVATVPVGVAFSPKAERIRQTLLAQQKWGVKDEATRVLRYPIQVPTYNGTGAILEIGVAHAVDNSGDKGVTYELLSTEGQIVQRGFLKGKDYEWIKYPADSGQTLEFVIMDKDTSFEGEAPGNGGRIQIELEVIKESSSSAER